MAWLRLTISLMAMGLLGCSASLTTDGDSAPANDASNQGAFNVPLQLTFSQEADQIIISAGPGSVQLAPGLQICWQEYASAGAAINLSASPPGINGAFRLQAPLAQINRSSQTVLAAVTDCSQFGVAATTTGTRFWPVTWPVDLFDPAPAQPPADPAGGSEEEVEVLGLPPLFSNATRINLSIATVSERSYRYKLGLAASINCNDESGYEAGSTTDSDDLDIDMSALPDGEYRMCVQVAAAGAQGLNTIWDETVDHTFVKDTEPPQFVVASDIETPVPFRPSTTSNDATQLQYTWSQVSGPGQLSFSDDSADPAISADVNGSYVVRVEIVDQAGNTASKDFNFVWRLAPFTMSLKITKFEDPTPILQIFNPPPMPELQIFTSEDCSGEPMLTVDTVQPFTEVQLNLTENGSYAFRVSADGADGCLGSPIYHKVFRQVEASDEIVEIVASDAAFAARYNNGMVVTWGDYDKGGDSSHIADKLAGDVVQVVASTCGFAARKTDGSVVSWGGTGCYETNGTGDSLSSGIVNLHGFRRQGKETFVAQKADGSAVVWPREPDYTFLVEPPSILPLGTEFHSTYLATAALKPDGTVVAWGNSSYGGDASEADITLENVVKLGASHDVFYVITSDNKGSTWGFFTAEHSYHSIDLSSDVADIEVSSQVGLVLRTDGSAEHWAMNDPFGNWASSFGSHLNSGIDQIFNLGFTVGVRKGTTLRHFGIFGSSTVGVSGGIHSIYSAGSATALLMNDGSVIGYGDTADNNDFATVAASLSANVDSIYTNGGDFYALKTDGAVVSWGVDGYIGPGSAASDITSDVSGIALAGSAFAAWKDDGSLVTWGSSTGGASTSGITEQLSSGVVDIIVNSDYVSNLVTYTTRAAIAAIKDDGSVVTWGDSAIGGDSSAVSAQLNTGVVKVIPSRKSFAAIKDDNSIIAWGDQSYGGDITLGSPDFSGAAVVDIVGGNGAFAAIKADGSVTAWGHPSAGADLSGVQSELVNIQKIELCESYYNASFFAIDGNGKAINWPKTGDQGTLGAAASEVTSGVTEIVSGYNACYARKSDQSIAVWGNASYGGTVPVDLQPVIASPMLDVVPTSYGMAGITADNDPIGWGYLTYMDIPAELTGKKVKKLLGGGRAIALTTDNKVISWGSHSPIGWSAESLELIERNIVDIKTTGTVDYAEKSDGSIVAWLGNRVFEITRPIKNLYHVDTYLVVHYADNTVGGYDIYDEYHYPLSPMIGSGVSKLFQSGDALIALKQDGSVATWGSYAHGAGIYSVD